MPLSSWFPGKKPQSVREQKGAIKQVPDGIWSKCASCNKIVYQKELRADLMVCPQCGHHYQMTAAERIDLIADPGSFKEFDAGISSVDPLGFEGSKPYMDTLERAKSRTDLHEAVVYGTATIMDSRVVLGVMDFRFVGASMGSAVGEKITRSAEKAIEERCPLVLFCASGGARMQEGMLSLMQMAKTSAAMERLGRAGIPYIAVLTDPTTGGVSASFATLADIMLAEPKALIGFAGPRVIEQTIGQKLPKGFQRSEFLLDHGMLDQIVPRSEMRERLATIISHLNCPAPQHNSDNGSKPAAEKKPKKPTAAKKKSADG